MFYFFLFFSLYIEKKNQLFLISQLLKQVHLGTVCIVLTVLQGRSLPPQMHTHTARAQLLSIYFLNSFIFPIISSDFSSQAMFSLCCKCESEQHHPAVHCRVREQASQTFPFKIIFNLLLKLVVINF